MAEKRFEYRYAIEDELEEMKHREFSGWMFTYVSAGLARGETFDDWIREMVVGPNFVVKSYPRFCTRGYAFTTQKRRRSSTTYDAGVCSASGDDGHFPRNFPRDNSLGKFRGTDPSEYTEGTVPRNKPRKKSVGILLSIDVYMSKHASIDELPRNYPDEVLPRYIPRTFPTNKGSSEFPRKFISSEFRRKIPRDFRGKKKFRGIISDDVFRRNCVGITIFRRNSDDFFPQNP
uniref:Uncharacterized protein n=1 Tax=Brassica oleracea var. oleracea TaxID=109376 RepID=A0A0D3DM89_BRAOL